MTHPNSHVCVSSVVAESYVDRVEDLLTDRAIAGLISRCRIPAEGEFLTLWRAGDVAEAFADVFDAQTTGFPIGTTDPTPPTIEMMLETILRSAG